MREISLPLPWSTVEKISGRLHAATRGVWRLIKEKPLGAFGGVIVLGLLLCALLAPWIATNPYDQTNVRNRLKPPSSQFYFGTDNLGRDIFSRIIYGARVSVTVGFGAVSIGMCLATFVGVGSGYFGGKADVLVQRLVDSWMAIPTLLLLLNVMAVLGPGLLNVILALGVVSAARNSRIIRSAVVSVRENMYVHAAQSIGASTPRILWRHILPNVLPPIIVLFTTRVGIVILAESGLSFLGLGVPPPAPTPGRRTSAPPTRPASA